MVVIILTVRAPVHGMIMFALLFFFDCMAAHFHPTIHFSRKFMWILIEVTPILNYLMLLGYAHKRVRVPTKSNKDNKYFFEPEPLFDFHKTVILQLFSTLFQWFQTEHQTILFYEKKIAKSWSEKVYFCLWIL